MTLFKIIFKMKLFQWRYSLLLIPIALWLSVNSVQAASNITCTAGMNTIAGSTGSVNLGTITLTNADSATVGGTLNYSCANAGNTTGYVSVCLAADGGYEPEEILPRRMRLTSNADANEMAFNMTLPGGRVWGTRSSKDGMEYQPGLIAVSQDSTFSDTVPIRIFLVPNEKNAQVMRGIYTNSINNINNGLTYARSDSRDSPPDCKTTNLVSARLPFTVQATVISSCFINATSDVNLGSRLAGATNITGYNNSAINVTCTPEIPYNVGLSPSNGNVGGAGIMSGTGSNPDKIPYQLRSSSGLTGQPWGNTATATTVGNGITDGGDGKPKLHPVYVTVPKADVRPDRYSDIVTISVNY